MPKYSEHQKEVLRMIWAASLGALYHKERAYFNQPISRLVNLGLFSSFFYLGVLEPMQNRWWRVIPDVWDSVAWCVGVLSGLVLFAWQPNSRAGLHSRLSNDYAALNKKIVELSDRMPEAYITLFKEDLRYLEVKEGIRWPLVNLYCNNQLLSKVQYDTKEMVAQIPKWKVWLRNVVPFEAPDPKLM